MSTEDRQNMKYCVVSAELEVRGLLVRLSPKLLYHCAAHTLQHVYPVSLELAAGEGLDTDDQSLASIIALFHDVGFLTQYEQHEIAGAEYAYRYALNSGSEPLRRSAQLIYDAILQTNMQTSPKNLVEKIIRDADLSILGNLEFMTWNNNLREEALMYPESRLYAAAKDDKTWAESQLKFFQNHKWFTQSATAAFDRQKNANIDSFRKSYADALTIALS